MKKDADDTSENMKWTPQNLLERLPSLVLVIDLTNTNRYYNPGNLKKLKKETEESDKPRNNLNSSEVPFSNSISQSSSDSDNIHCLHRCKNDSVPTSNIDQSNCSNQLMGIKYVKIHTQGHVVPDSKVVQR